MSMASFGVLSKNTGFYPSSDRIVEINAQTLEYGTWRQIIQWTNILPTVPSVPSYYITVHSSSMLTCTIVRVWPCILNSVLLQHISDASLKLFHILWCIAYWTPHVMQLCTTPCIHASTCATSACLFVCLPLSPAHMLLVLFVCFPFQIGSVNWWAVDQC